jgi:hypothetical protein
MYCIKIGTGLVAKDFKSYPEALAWKKYHCPKGRVVKQ